MPKTILTPTPYAPRFAEYLYASALPETLRDQLRERAMNNWYHCQDIGDGDFYYIVNLADDTTLTRKLVKRLAPETVAKNKLAILFTS